MRLIAGKWRGRRIDAPAHDRTRPILDRAKTVLFDVLGHRLAQPGRLPPIAVLDLYAGSGAMGLEALSRGARYCLFVEKSRGTSRLIAGNIDALGAGDETCLLTADASRVSFPAPPPDEQERSRYGLVFVDPPYRELSQASPTPAVRHLLARLDEEETIAPEAIIIVRHPQVRAAESIPDLSPLVEIERRDVGTMTFRFMTTRRARVTENS